MISVVIPAFNEQDTIGRCLESLVQQQTKRKFEVILVDNASTDTTVALAKTFSDRLTLRIITETKRGRGAARYRGFAEATGSILLSTDADVQLPPTWIDAFASAVEKDPYVAATGVARIEDLAPWRNALFNFFLPRLIKFNKVRYGHVGLSGYGFSIRKDVYQEAGGFDPDADAYEDLELAMRVAKLGKIALVESPTILFSGRRFQKGLLAGCYEYTYTYIQRFFARKRRVLLSKVK